MSDLQAWAVSLAATLTALAAVWRMVLRPTVAAAREFARDVRKLAEIVDEWPTHAAAVERAGIEIGRVEGELRAAVERNRRDLDTLWTEHREIRELCRSSA